MHDNPQTRRIRSGGRLRLLPAAALVAIALLAAACAPATEDPGEAGRDVGVQELPPCPLDALDNATAPVEIVVWHTQTAKPADTLAELVAQYNAEQSRVRVRLESQGANYQELQRKFEAAVATRQLPDLLVFDDTALQVMADSGVVLPAQSCIDAAGLDTSGFRQVAVDYYTIDGVLWPASANLGSALLYYNRNHWRAAGLDPAVTPGNLAEIREMSERIDAAGVVDTPFVHEFASWKTEFFLTGAGAPIVDNENGRGEGETTAAALQPNEQATELFEWFETMQQAGLMTPVPRVDGQIDQYLAMANQQASMMVESSSAATSVEAFLAGDTGVTDDVGEFAPTDLGRLDIGVGPFPGISESGRTQMGGAAWYMTNTNAPERQAAAWDFMVFMNSVPAQARMLTGGSFLPYTVAALDDPTVQEFFRTGMAGPWLKVANDQIDQIDPAFPGPLIGPYFETREAIEEAQDQLMFGGATPDEALAQAQEAVTTALRRYAEQGF